MNIPLPGSTANLTRALALSCATLSLTLSFHSSAQANDYVGTLTDPDLWSIGANWNGGLPVNGQNVTIGAVVPPNGGPNVNFDFAFISPGLNSLTLNPVSVFIPATLNQTDPGTGMIAITETIGTDFIATYNHNNGTNSAGTLLIGTLASGTGTYNLAGVATVSGGAESIGVSGTGTFNQSGGSNSVSGSLEIASNVGGVGTYNLTGGTLLAGAEVIGNSGTGTFNQSGGTNFVSGSLTIASNVGSAGTYNLSGGTLTVNGTGISNNGTFNLTNSGVLAGTGGLTNNGTVNFAGGSLTLSGAVSNNSGASIYITANTTFSGPVTNNLGATIKVTTPAIATYSGGMTNFGTLISDPTTSGFTYLTIGTTGVVQGGVGDVFSVSGDLLNQSTQNIAFDIDAALILLDGPSTHQLTWPGADLGASYAGYADNFAVGIFELAAGGSLDFVSGALYVSVLDLDGGLAQAGSITGSGQIYYDPSEPENAYLAGGTYGGGIIAPVPEPSASVLIAGAGALLLGRWRRRAVARAA